jgi:starvation-inducible DNA-binding protein
MATQTRATPSVSDRDMVAGELQNTLVELIDLSLQGKQAHWNLVGPNFRSLHLQLDEMIAEYRAWSDLVGERMVAIGVPADGRAQTVASAEAVQPFPAGEVSDRDVLKMFVDRLSSVGDRVRERMNRLADADAASQDILIDIVNGLDKQLWMIRAQLA